MALQIYYGSYFSWVTETVPWHTQEELTDFWYYNGGTDNLCPADLLELQEPRGISLALIVPGSLITVEPGNPLDIKRYLSMTTPNPRQVSDFTNFMRAELDRWHLPRWLAGVS